MTDWMIAIAYDLGVVLLTVVHLASFPVVVFGIAYSAYRILEANVGPLELRAAALFFVGLLCLASYPTIDQHGWSYYKLVARPLMNTQSVWTCRAKALRGGRSCGEWEAFLKGIE